MDKKTKIIPPTLPKGTRDFLPAQVRQREKVISLVKSVFEKYGYEPLETPAIENLEVLSGKYGEEGERLIFKILKRGEELKSSLGQEKKDGVDFTQLTDLALRYDLTVPLSRVVAMYQNEIKLPFKRYQIQPVWRADRPQKGRYREFYQCDADIVGSASLLADAEIIQITCQILKALKFEEFKVRFNHRRILNGIVDYCGVSPEKSKDVILALDKFDKIGREGVREELEKKGIPAQVAQKLLPILDIRGTGPGILQEMGKLLKNSTQGVQGVRETSQLWETLQTMGIEENVLSLDLYLARGLEYYTGPIFESFVEKPKIGSLTGGGRYDKLIGMFLGRDLPATGTTIGLERIIDVMTELRMLEDVSVKTSVLVTIISPQTRKISLQIAGELRQNDINCEVYLDENDPLRDQIGYASSKGIRVVIIAGPKELQAGEVLVKDLKSGQQQSCPPPKVVAAVRQLLSP